MKADVSMVVVIILSLMWAAWKILPAANSYTAPPVNKPTWEPPEIPMCDKPLWERIKDGCE